MFATDKQAKGAAVSHDGTGAGHYRFEFDPWESITCWKLLRRII